MMAGRGTSDPIAPGAASPGFRAADPDRETAAGSRRPTPGARRPAGYWRRLVALGVDLGVVMGPLAQLGRLVTDLLSGSDLVARAFELTWRLLATPAYFVLLHGATGQTLGKLLLGARVVRADGELAGYLRAVARLVLSPPAIVMLAAPVPIGSVLFALLLATGNLVVAFRRDKRGLHDLLAGTRVVCVR